MQLLPTILYIFGTHGQDWSVLTDEEGVVDGGPEEGEEEERLEADVVGDGADEQGVGYGFIWGQEAQN